MRLLFALVATATAMAGQAIGQEAVVPDAVAATSVQVPVADPAVAVAQTTEVPAAPTPQGFQVARLGDSQKSCEVLVAEINSLNTEMTDAQGAMSERAMDVGRSRMRGMQTRSVASTALSLGTGVAAALVPGAALAVGAVQSVAGMAGQAAAVAQEARQQREMDTMMEEMTAGSQALMPLMNRIDHLTDISISKGC